jgi:hypothetical protein
VLNLSLVRALYASPALPQGEHHVCASASSLKRFMGSYAIPLDRAEILFEMIRKRTSRKARVA